MSPYWQGVALTLLLVNLMVLIFQFFLQKG